jgi:hypothetical protein
VHWQNGSISDFAEPVELLLIGSSRRNARTWLWLVIAGLFRPPALRGRRQDIGRQPGNGFWMPPNLTGIIYAILCARSSTICYGSSIDLSQGILLVHPHRRGMTSSDEKPNQDKDAAKTKLSHSTEIRPPLVPLANLREAVVGARCKPSLPSSIIVQGCREPSPVLGLAPGIRRSST